MIGSTARPTATLVLCVFGVMACGNEVGPPPAAATLTPLLSPSPAEAAPARTPAAARPAGEPSTAEATAINPRLLRRFQSVANRAPTVQTTPEQVTLGRMLWFDTRLSQDRDLSCDSCHTLSAYGVDGRVTSTGHRGQQGRRNAPTVYNAAEHFTMFWDGRARDVEAQATGPILNPGEMAMTAPEVVARLRRVPAYVRQFGEAFPEARDPLTITNVGRAIAAFERGLTTRSRWDDFLNGQSDALTPAEQEGLRVFLNVGCMGCHTGPQIGASMYQVAGVVEAWPNQRDLGRFEVTQVVTDRMVFKVPTLRNIARTAPYFHDGSAATLPDAVRAMGRHQLGIQLGDGEVRSIVTFLNALTGELPTGYIQRPTLPPDA